MKIQHWYEPYDVNVILLVAVVIDAHSKGEKNPITLKLVTFGAL